MERNRKFLITAFIVSLFVVILLAPFASSFPDGLERVAEDKGFIEKDSGSLIQALFPDYEATFTRSPYLKVVIPGVFGVAATFLVASGTALILTRPKNNGTRVS